MAETKRNMIKRLSRPENHGMAMVLSHGSYASREGFNVPTGIVIIFVSRTARYLPQSVVNSEFYNVFTRTQRIHNILSNPNSRPPIFLKDWERRTYGPGDLCPNLKLEMNDPAWGMGIHALPLVQNQLRTTPGIHYGRTMKLSDLISTMSGSGILFVTACRATTTQLNTYMNLTSNYSFPLWSLEYNLQRQNEISSRMLKRRRNTNSIRKNKNTPDSKTRRINNRMNTN